MKPSPEEPPRKTVISRDTFTQETSTSSSSEELVAPSSVSVGVQTEEPLGSAVINPSIPQNVPNPVWPGNPGNIVNIQNPENLLPIVGMENLEDPEIENMEIVETSGHPMSPNYSENMEHENKMESATEDSQSPENPENMKCDDNSRDVLNPETPMQIPIVENISSDSSQAKEDPSAAASPRLQALMRRSPPSEISSTSNELQQTDDEVSLPAREEQPFPRKAEIRAATLTLEETDEKPRFREIHGTSHDVPPTPTVVECEPGPSTSRTIVVGGSIKIVSPSKSPKKISQRRDQTEFETGKNGSPDVASQDDEGISSEPEMYVEQDDDGNGCSLWRRRKGRTVHGSAVGHRSRSREANLGGSGVESGASTPAPIMDIPSIGSTSSDVSEHEHLNVSPSPTLHIPPPSEEANMEMLEISPTTGRRRKLSRDHEGSIEAGAKKMKTTDDDEKMETDNPSTMGSDDKSELSETIIISSDSSSSMKESSPGSSIPTDDISNSPIPPPMFRNDEIPNSPLLARMLSRGSSDDTSNSPLPARPRRSRSRSRSCDSIEDADMSTYL